MNSVKLRMELLGIKDITTERQKKNGTVIWKLPIKKYGQFIKVGSFESGYVRRMNCEGMYGAVRSYQLNKCENVDHYYKDYDCKWVNGEYIQKFTGKYNKFVGKKRILIPDYWDRLEYLIGFCLKNYYINQANMIENGDFIPKWKYEDMKNRFEEAAMELDELTVSVNGHRYKVI